MGLFSHSSPPILISPEPLITYTFHQNLAGKLTITSSQQNTYAYTITLTKRKAWRETIEVAIHGGPYSNPLSSCLIETRRARFQDVQFNACGQYLRLERSTSALRSGYASISFPGPMIMNEYILYIHVLHETEILRSTQASKEQHTPSPVAPSPHPPGNMITTRLVIQRAS